MNARPHWLALDGVRAVAVTTVVLLHAAVPVHGGGFGVDVFFALSGFLITGLLWDEARTTGRISRRKFYARRALRLLPALLVCCALTVAVDIAVRRGGGHLEALPFVLGYASNWYVSADSQALGFFGQTWSLSIEEQFYLAWPFVVLALTRSSRPLGWLAAIIACGAVSRVAGVLLVGTEATLWTTSRVDELAVGATAALLMRQGWRPPTWVTWTCIAGLGAHLLRGLPGRLTELVGMTLVAAMTAVVLVSVVTAPQGIAARLLSVPPLVGLGRVSYGAYLYHYPILLGMAAQGYSHRAVVAVGLPLTMAVTVASWFLVERPLNRLKDRAFSVPRMPVGRPTTLASAAATESP